MRVLQLIDSLETGGAERVAINIANSLSSKIENSFLCSTRKEGPLKSSISSDVNFLFLNKKGTIDLKAIMRLRRFVKSNKIDIIHAHSTSFFLATLIKGLYPKVKIVWHDHYGNSDYLEERASRGLVFCSRYFSQVFSVNKKLEHWGKENLNGGNVSYLPNFAVRNAEKAVTELKGESRKRIVCLANLRPQKDHFTLIDTFAEVVKKHPEWTLHCVGKDLSDDYSEAVKNRIEALNLKSKVFIYGNKIDTVNILGQCEIGVLSSKSEGLPLSLLEYGLSNLAIVTTNVGECSQVVTHKENGLLVPVKNNEALKMALVFLIENEKNRKNYAVQFHSHILQNYSEKEQMLQVINAYREILK